MSTFRLNTKNEVETLVHALRETLFDSIYIHRRHEISRTIMNSLIIPKTKAKEKYKNYLRFNDKLTFVHCK